MNGFYIDYTLRGTSTKTEPIPSEFSYIEKNTDLISLSKKRYIHAYVFHILVFIKYTLQYKDYGTV